MHKYAFSMYLVSIQDALSFMVYAFIMHEVSIKIHILPLMLINRTIPEFSLSYIYLIN